MLWWATAWRKTFPVPVVSLAANPSASSPSESALSCDSALRTRLSEGQSAAGVVEAIRPSWSPVSRLKRVTVRSMTLSLPPT